MNKVIYSVALVALLLIAACTTTPTGEVVKEKQIKIGAVHSLSGELVQLAHGSVNGVRMAAEDFEAQTGIPVQLIEEDDKSCAEKTAGANKLVNLDGVEAIVGTICSSMTLAIAPITEPAKVLVMSGVSTSTAVTDAGDYVFRTIPADDAKARKVAEEIRKGGFTRVAFIFANDNDFSITVVADIKKGLATGTVAAEETGIVTTHDFRTQLLKVKEAKPDVLVLSFTNPAQFTDVMQQWRELGLEKIPVYTTSETIESPEVLTVGGEAVEGILFPAFAPASGAAAQAFAAKYKSKFGEDVPAYAAESYDGTMIVLKALAESSTPEEAQAKMFEIGKGYGGASGVVTFDENGDVHKELLMKTIRDGAFVVVG